MVNNTATSVGIRRSKKQLQFAQNIRDVDNFLNSKKTELGQAIVNMGAELFGSEKLDQWLAGDNAILNTSPISLINQGEQGQQRVADMLVVLKLKREICLN